MFGAGELNDMKFVAAKTQQLSQFDQGYPASLPGLKKDDIVDDFFWQELIDHPNYDSVWQKKGIIQHLKNIKPSVATMVVGGWFDAEDLYGPLETYKGIEKNGKENTYCDSRSKLC